MTIYNLNQPPSLHSVIICRMTRFWRCVSTAPPAGQTQTAPSGTVSTWSTESANAAACPTRQQSCTIREWEVERFLPSVCEFCSLTPPPRLCACVCACVRIRADWEELHPGCSAPSPLCPASWRRKAPSTSTRWLG